MKIKYHRITIKTSCPPYISLHECSSSHLCLLDGLLGDRMEITGKSSTLTMFKINHITHLMLISKCLLEGSYKTQLHGQKEPNSITTRSTTSLRKRRSNWTSLFHLIKVTWNIWTKTQRCFKRSSPMNYLWVMQPSTSRIHWPPCSRLSNEIP